MDPIFSDIGNIVQPVSPNAQPGAGAAESGITVSPSTTFDSQLNQVYGKGRPETGEADGNQSLVEAFTPDENPPLADVLTPDETLSFHGIGKVLERAFSEVRTGTGDTDENPSLAKVLTPDETLSSHGMGKVLERAFSEVQTETGDTDENPSLAEVLALDETLSSHGIDKVLERAFSEVRTGDADVYKKLEDTLNRRGGLAFLTELKQLLLSFSNGDLDSLSINEEGLGALEELLGDAGFDPDAIEKLMTQFRLSEVEGEGKIRASEFMDKLFELPRKEEGDDITETQMYMASSVLPYIQSLLGVMGIDQEKISSIMSEASQGTRGFDADIFVEQLRQLGEISLNTEVSYQTGTDETFHINLLEQLGLASDTGSQDPFTLNQLIQAFEQNKQDFTDRVPDTKEVNTAVFAQTEGGGGGTQGLLSQMFSNIELSSTQTAAVNTDLITGQIREQIKADVLNQGSGVQPGQASPVKEMAIDTIPGKDLGDPGKESGASPGARSDLFETTGEKNRPVSQANENGSGYTDTVSLVQSGKTDTGVLGASMDKVRQTFNSLPDHVTRQVGNNIVRTVNLGEDTLRLQLKPPELGRVFMTIDNKGDTIKVSIITEHQSAKDILSANVNEIKTLLSNSGISLERFEVDMSGDFRQSMADARGQDQSGRKKSAKNFNKGNEAEDENTPHITTLHGALDTGSGSLHYVA